MPVSNPLGQKSVYSPFEEASTDENYGRGIQKLKPKAFVLHFLFFISSWVSWKSCRKAPVEAECARSWRSKGPAVREPGGSEGGKAKEERANGGTAWSGGDTSSILCVGSTKSIEMSFHSSHVIPLSSSLLHPPTLPPSLLSQTHFPSHREKGRTYLAGGGEWPTVCFEYRFCCYSLPHHLWLP